MKNTLLLLCLFSGLWITVGCEVPPPPPPVPENNPLEGLKINDLRDTSQERTFKESLMSFRVLTYTILPVVTDKLQAVYDTLSEKDVRPVNQSAFKANGFAVGVGTLEQSREVVQKLVEIGAVRTSQTRLIMPPDKPEVLSRTFLQVAKKISYSSGSSEADIMLEPGCLGWVISPKPDPRFRGMAQVNLYPAAWQQGIENIRLLMGKEPVEYRPFDECRLLARVEENGFILLGPARGLSEYDKLDKLLFYLPGKQPKVQFFIIIYDSMGSR